MSTLNLLILLLWVIAAVFMGLRAFGVVGARVHLGWLGLTCAAVAVILTRL